jgi:glutaminyl-peptide cyclotransferase
MIRNNAKWIIFTLLLVFVGSALIPVFSKFFGDDPSVSGGSTVEMKPLPDITIPKFNADTAYLLTEKLVSYGPRVTSTEGAAKVKKWIVEGFKKAGADVIEQNFKDKTYDGKPLNCTNIIARYNLQATKRIVLSAHWDSRQVADQDSTKPKEPIVGADDSGSAIAMLMEIGHQLQAQPLSNVGVDIVLFDAEDMGEKNSENGWCIGSKYWSANPHTPNYVASYGILLDMAGAKGARFTKEMISQKFAPSVVEKVWRVARQKYGYDHLFVEETSRGPLTDDHVYVNQIAKIPMIDIINHPVNSFFGEYWHTHHDDMSVIDKETMRAVGQTLLGVLHYEQVGAFQ